MENKRLIISVGSPIAGGTVDSVNGKIGVVVLDGTDIETEDGSGVTIKQALDNLDTEDVTNNDSTEFAGLYTQYDINRSLVKKSNTWVSAEDFGAVGDGVTDDSTAIQNALNTGSVLLLGKTYLIGSALTVPIGYTLKGSGHVTELTTSLTTGSVITIESEGRVQDLKMIGNGSFTNNDINSNSLYPENLTELDARKGEGDLIGITTNDKRCSINNVYFTQFTKYAIHTVSNAVNISSQPLRNDISDNVFHLNYISVLEGERSEYQVFTNNVFKYNIINIIVQGGNNSHVNNKIDHARFNVVVEGALFTNHGHGEFTGGSINHAKIYAVVCRDVENGEIFSSISLFDGGTEGVYIKDSKGILMSTNVFSRIKLTCEGESSASDGPGQNKISNTLFKDNLQTNAYPIDVTGNTILENNDLFDGRDDQISNEYQLINNTKYDKDGFYYKNVNGSDTIIGSDVAEYNLNNTSTSGNLKIKLPVNKANQLISLDVEIVGLTRTANYTISGYAVSAAWQNCRVSTKSGDSILTVDYGTDDDGKAIIYLGDGGLWRWEGINIKRLSVTRGAGTKTSVWKYGWEISVTNETKKNIDQTVTPT